MRSTKGHKLTSKMCMSFLTLIQIKEKMAQKKKCEHIKNFKTGY